MDYLNSQLPPVAFLILYIWSMIWKGLALWKASKNDQKNWFIAILILNTAGILEIIFLFYFSKNRLKLAEIKNWINNLITFSKK